jgi:hypothetical protein
MSLQKVKALINIIEGTGKRRAGSVFEMDRKKAELHRQRGFVVFVEDAPAPAAEAVQADPAPVVVAEEAAAPIAEEAAPVAEDEAAEAPAADAADDEDAPSASPRSRRGR